MRQPHVINLLKFLITKEDLDEAPLCIKILSVIRASLRAVARVMDALNMRERRTIRSSQFRLPLITI